MQLGAANYIVQTIFKSFEKTWTHKQYFSHLDEALAFKKSIPEQFETKLWSCAYEVIETIEPKVGL
jgi:hypothetical protein